RERNQDKAAQRAAQQRPSNDPRSTAHSLPSSLCRKWHCSGRMSKPGGRARSKERLPQGYDRPSTRGEEAGMKGIDVNGKKGTINWARVRADGYEFAFVKATEGKTFDDERFAFNRRAAKAAGLVVGAYHYARPDNNTPEAEAQHFLRVARPLRGELLPALDWETEPPTAGWASRFLRAVETEIGTPPILYTYPDFLRRTGHLNDFHRFPLWYSRFGTNDGQVHP